MGLIRNLIITLALVSQAASFAPRGGHLFSAMKSARQATASLTMRVDKGSRAPPEKKQNTMVMNEKIKAKELRVVVAGDGKEGADQMLGVMSKEEAMAKADELGLDLVLISETSVPPVAKVVDAGKLAYQLERKKKENIKKTNTKDLKEIKLSYNIGEHDYGVRYRNAEKFIKAGHRVKATVMFRGREQQHVDIGDVLLQKLAKEMAEFAVADRPKREGNRLSMFLKPKSEK